MGVVDIGGSAEEGFDAFAKAFRRQLGDEGRGENAQLCVYFRGKRVVDLWGSAVGDEVPDLTICFKEKYQ